jgi:hypothetical protein
LLWWKILGQWCLLLQMTKYFKVIENLCVASFLSCHSYHSLCLFMYPGGDSVLLHQHCFLVFKQWEFAWLDMLCYTCTMMISSGQLIGLLRKSNTCTKFFCKSLISTSYVYIYILSLLFKQTSSGYILFFAWHSYTWNLSLFWFYISVTWQSNLVRRTMIK